MKRSDLWKFGAALAATTLLAAGSALADNPKMIIYVSPNPLGVNEFLKMGKTGTNAIAKKLGAKSRTYEAKDPTTRKQDVEAAVRDGADIVIVLGFEFNDIIPEVAAKNPKTKFLIIDQFIDKHRPMCGKVFSANGRVLILLAPRRRWSRRAARSALSLRSISRSSIGGRMASPKVLRPRGPTLPSCQLLSSGATILSPIRSGPSSRHKR